MTEIVGKHLTLKEAKDSAIRMSEFWNEEYRVYAGTGIGVFTVERGWPKRDGELFSVGARAGQMI